MLVTVKFENYSVSSVMEHSFWSCDYRSCLSLMSPARRPCGQLGVMLNLSMITIRSSYSQHPAMSRS